MKGKIGQFCYLLFGYRMANFGPLSKGQPHLPDVNHQVFAFSAQDYWKPHNGVGPLSPVERLLGFEPGTFRFWLERLNSLGHSPQIWLRLCFLKIIQNRKVGKFWVKSTLGLNDYGLAIIVCVKWDIIFSAHAMKSFWKF